MDKSFIDEVNEVILTVPVPITLPAEAFSISDKDRNRPDFDIIISRLPIILRSCLDLEATMLHSKRSGHMIYLLH